MKVKYFVNTYFTITQRLALIVFQCFDCGLLNHPHTQCFYNLGKLVVGHNILTVLIKRSSSYSPFPCSHWHHLHVEPSSPTDWFVPSPLANNHASYLQFPSLRRDGLNAWIKKKRSDYWDILFIIESQIRNNSCVPIPYYILNV